MGCSQSNPICVLVSIAMASFLDCFIGEMSDIAGSRPDGGESAPPINVSDKRISALAAAAGTDEAVSRGKWIAAGMVIVGMVGAIGVGLRPIYRQHFATRAAAVQRSADAAKRVMAREAGHELPPAEAVRLAELLERLDVLQSRHRARHPLWYGEPTPDMLVPPPLPAHVRLANDGLEATPVLDTTTISPAELDAITSESRASESAPQPEGQLR